jgi:hypothetical protein
VAKLWWQSPAGITHGLDLTEYADLSVLNEGNAEIAAVSTSWAGRSATLVHHRLPTIAVEVNDVSKANALATIALLRNFAEHYRSGGLFAFAVNEDTAWFSYLTLPAAAAQTGFTTLGCLGWAAGSAALPVGAEVVVEQGYPLDQVHGVTSSPTLAAGTGVTISAPGSILTRDAGATIRARDYYPALTRDDGDGFTETNDRGLFYSFRFTAQVSTAHLLAGSGLWQSASFTEDAVAPSGRRILEVFAPVNGPSPGSSYLDLGLYSAQVNTGPNPRRV